MRFNKIPKTEFRVVTIFVCFVAACLAPGCNDSQTTKSIECNELRPLSETVDVASQPLSPKKNTDATFIQKRAVENSLIIGLDADMTSGSAQSGLAIRRGVVLALDEINAAGGLLGRPVELIVRDHRGNPDRGVDNIVEFAEMSDVLAVVGGLHTPVALRELKTIHDQQMIYLGPWAAGTPIVQNEYSPNFVFRVSVRDEYAGGFLVDRALERGLSKIGLLLERTGWGRVQRSGNADRN